MGASLTRTDPSASPSLSIAKNKEQRANAVNNALLLLARNYLTPAEVIQCSAVCSRVYSLLSADETLWESLFKRYFGNAREKPVSRFFWFAYLAN